MPPGAIVNKNGLFTIFVIKRGLMNCEASSFKVFVSACRTVIKDVDRERHILVGNESVA